jgi:hypothetical protein
MEDKGKKQGWRRKRKEHKQIRSGGARDREKDELYGERMRVAQVRIFAPVPPTVYSTWGSNAPGNFARDDN